MAEKDNVGPGIFLFLIVTIAVFYASCSMEKFNAKCKELGGHPDMMTCYKKDALIPVPGYTEQ